VPADICIDALRVFTKNDEVDLIGALGLERDQTISERADGTDVRIEVAPEANTEEDVAGMLEAGYAWIAQRAEQHCRRARADLLQHVGRHGDPVAKVTIGPEVEIPELERQSCDVAVKLEQEARLARDFHPDPVPRKDRYFFCRHVPGNTAKRGSWGKPCACATGPYVT
jgi:hypothetical protein